ncbi:MAG TPA: hypothetical protein VLB50_01975 [Ignavibacteriaceae bacterium]|nr:hypothetical protein [Ignavibacteriaceae bacterium]
MKKILIIISFISCTAFTQQSELSKTVNYLSKFIASDYFGNLHDKMDDLALTDTLFNRAVRYRNNDYSEALFSLMLTTVPYKKVPIQIPLIKLNVLYPLTSAGDSIFFLKNRNLPKNFYFDTPQNKFGDRDKLAHFFGSAFLAYNSSIFDLGDLIGYFVEVFEEEFKVQSQIDNRDLMTNRLGYLFGTELKRNKNIHPSDAFLLRTLIYTDLTFP